MKKIVCALLSLSLFTAPSAQVLDFAGFDNIDTIMEDNSFTDTANRYSAVQLSYFPERATRLGFESADNKLDARDEERDARALRALHIVQDNFKQLNRKRLSEQKKTEYDMLEGLLTMDIYNANHNRPANDPLFYSNVFDALYDLRMKTLNYQELQDRDLGARFAALPTVTKQAENNLTAVPSFFAQLAMEQAYYAYLSFDAIPQYLLSRAQDDVSLAQTRADARSSRTAVKGMFDLFKKLAQENTDRDFRLGERPYEQLLKNYYFIDQNFSKMSRYLNKNFALAQRNLLKAIEGFALPADLMPEEMVVMEEMKVPGEEAQEGVTVSEIEKPAKPKNKNKKDKNAPIVTVEDFYPLAQRLTQNVESQNFISALSNEATNLNKLLVQDETLPIANVSFKIRELPGYYAYTLPYKFMPPFGTQTDPTVDFFVRLPSGNETTKQEMLNRDFNIPTLKLLVAGQLVPGLAYRSAYNHGTISSFRKMYHVPTLRNGWEVYAQHLANERGYIITDEEQLFLAWADYVRAAKALVDFYLHTLQFTYVEALNWLTENNGFEQAQAEQMLKEIATQPGEAVSYIYGYDAIKNLRTKYQKKQGKKFSLSDFHAKVMSMGDIPPKRLEAEMENAYLIEKNRVSQALNTPFYMN